MKILRRTACWTGIALLTALTIWLGLLVNRAHIRKVAVQCVLEKGGVVYYDWQFDKLGQLNNRQHPPVAPWIRRVLGDSCFQRVEVIDCDWLDENEVRCVARLSHLKRLYLDCLASDLSPLSGLQELKVLDVSGSMHIIDFLPLSQMSELEELDISHTDYATDLSPLSELVQLRRLDVEGTNVCDLSPLSSLSKLEELDLTCTKAVDLSPLASLQNLRKISLWGATGVSDLSPLAGLSNLQSLDITYTGVEDLTPLCDLVGLQELGIDSSQLAGHDVATIRSRLPGCRIEIAPYPSQGE